MAQGPVTLRVDEHIEIGAVLAQKLSGMETVIAEKPVGLIQPVLPQQGRGSAGVRQRRVFIERHIGGEKHPLQVVLLVETLRHGQKLQVRLPGRSDDHLRTLSRRNEGGIPALHEGGNLNPGGSRSGKSAAPCQGKRSGGGRRKVRILLKNGMAKIPVPGGSLHVRILSDGQAVGDDALPDQLHGPDQTAGILVGSQQPQSFLCGKLNIDAHPVCQTAGLKDQLLRRAGDGLHMDIAVEPVLRPEEQEGPVQKLHGMGRALHNAGA